MFLRTNNVSGGLSQVPRESDEMEENLRHEKVGRAPGHIGQEKLSDRSREAVLDCELPPGSVCTLSGTSTGVRGDQREGARDREREKE